MTANKATGDIDIFSLNTEVHNGRRVAGPLQRTHTSKCYRITCSTRAANRGARSEVKEVLTS